MRRVRSGELVRRMGSVLIPLLLLTVGFGGDLLLGFWNETAIVRDQARLFRSEAAYLRTTTLNLVPNLNHQYLIEGSTRSDPAHYRKFRTAQDGTVLGAEPAPKTGRRVLFLGGSTTETNEVDKSSRFPTVAARLLAASGLTVETLNGGVRGHTTQDSINAFLNRPGFREVDVVVLMENINDRLRLTLDGSYAGRLGVIAPTSFEAVIDAGRSVLASTWDYVTYRSNALFLLRNQVARFNAWTGERSGVEVNETAIEFGGDKVFEHSKAYAQNLRAFVAIAKALGVTPVLMTQPLGVVSPLKTLSMQR